MYVFLLFVFKNFIYETLGHSGPTIFTLNFKKCSPINWYLLKFFPSPPFLTYIMLRPCLVDLLFMVTHTQWKIKAWFCHNNFDHILFFSFEYKKKKRKIHTKLYGASKFTLIVIYFMNFMNFDKICTLKLIKH